MNKRIVLCFIFLFVPFSANADGTVLDLIRTCRGNIEKPEEAVGVTYCAGFLSGINELHTVYSDDKLKFGIKFYCPPQIGLQNEQLVKIFIKWADEHPEDLHQRASLGFLSAMKNAFPCKQ